MRIVIVGGGMAGLVLAQALERRGVRPVVLERMSEDAVVPGSIMLPWQAYDALRDIGVYDEIHSHSREVAPTEHGPVALAVGRQTVLDVLGRDLDVRRGVEVMDLLRAGDRVEGVRLRAGDGEADLASDLVVGADGTFSRMRKLAGIPCELTPSDTAGLHFRSPVVMDRPFTMMYQHDGRQVGLISWTGGSAGWWQIDRIGAEEALAPGIDEFRRCFVRLLPYAAPAVDALASMEQVHYREVMEVRCERWWVPGVIVIGEAAHAMDPEFGGGAGLGMGDALACAIAIAQSDEPDSACETYEYWRRPAVAPYTTIGARGSRMPTGDAGTPRPDIECWPPVA